jgi:hypothetical protein
MAFSLAGGLGEEGDSHYGQVHGVRDRHPRRRCCSASSGQNDDGAVVQAVAIVDGAVQSRAR